MDETEQREIEERLKEQIASYHEAALLFTAVTAGLPDLLKAEPRDPEALANDLGLAAGPLRRLLRGLVAMRLCEELDDGRFALRPPPNASPTAIPRTSARRPSSSWGNTGCLDVHDVFAAHGRALAALRPQQTAADWRGAKSDEAGSCSAMWPRRSWPIRAACTRP
ncbi:hypothetical protein AUC70_08355 [Methyloceanibacter stevinii]|uniref:PAC domain-containing protein n=1 Tax=Methyloceanibacter stevinii TaxID=1774970 RepID=A0A1E3VM64_9HYPH|nr:methyltransferase dimerization domain-containing protein [Methyloceanibacter stevinii]ODR94625.1 hypothetical protein AUC70_08355 [Methyloceanibacter stevinii]